MSYTSVVFPALHHERKNKRKVPGPAPVDMNATNTMIGCSHVVSRNQLQHTRLGYSVQRSALDVAKIKAHGWLLCIFNAV